MSTLGAASCLLMFPLLLAALSLLETGTLAWLTFMTSELWLPQFYFATTLGLGMGYLTGVWWVKRRTRRSLTYADLEPRRLSNYRSHWFFWLQVLFIALYGGLFVQATPLLDTL
ncbi:MAG TPA: hypothetical protein VFN35_31195, partial [Ktedonobacteraceae bacterium]|nr:hypothetical protein [Ktedonobacteraceae bacterium]